ncbi:MAG TPA: radical SAM-associated putative lipoprotein, partial [Paludibacter sp.]
MRKLFIKIFDKFLIGLMACTGLFSGCETVVEYGTPTADYEIKGTVTDSITSIPIQKARVIVTLTKKYLQQDTT